VPIENVGNGVILWARRAQPCSEKKGAQENDAPATRLMIFGQSAFCIVSAILIEHLHLDCNRPTAITAVKVIGP
jgi:hypothetical protein